MYAATPYTANFAETRAEDRSSKEYELLTTITGHLSYTYMSVPLINECSKESGQRAR